MATNLGLNDQLLSRAVAAGGHQSKREAVNAALNDYVKLKKRIRFLKLEGVVEFRSGWDHKADRRRGIRRIPKD